MNKDYTDILKQYTNSSILLLPLLEKYKNNWEYSYFLNNPNIPREFLWKNSIPTYKITFAPCSWFTLCKDNRISTLFLINTPIPLEILVSFRKVPLEFLESKLNQLELIILLTSRCIGDAFWKKHMYLLDNNSINILANNQNISEKFWLDVIENKSIVLDNTFWKNLCYNPNISNSFWETHLDKINWFILASCARFELWFLQKYKHLLKFDDLIFNHRVPCEFWEEIFDDIEEDNYSYFLEYSNINLKIWKRVENKRYIYYLSKNKNFFKNVSKELLEDVF